MYKASIVEPQQIACLSCRRNSQRYFCSRNSRKTSLRPNTAAPQSPGLNNQVIISSAFGSLGGQQRRPHKSAIVARLWSSSRNTSVGPSISDLRVVEKVGSMAVQTVQTPSTVSLEAPKVSVFHRRSIACWSFGTSALHHCTLRLLPCRLIVMMVVVANAKTFDCCCCHPQCLEDRMDALCNLHALSDGSGARSCEFLLGNTRPRKSDVQAATEGIP